MITTSISKYIIVALSTVIIILGVCAAWNVYRVGQLEEEILNQKVEISNLSKGIKDAEDKIVLQNLEIEAKKLEVNNLENKIATSLIGTTEERIERAKEVSKIEDDYEAIQFLLEDFSHE